MDEGRATCACTTNTGFGVVNAAHARAHGQTQPIRGAERAHALAMPSPMHATCRRGRPSDDRVLALAAVRILRPRRRHDNPRRGAIDQGPVVAVSVITTHVIHDARYTHDRRRGRTRDTT